MSWSLSAAKGRIRGNLCMVKEWTNFVSLDRAWFDNAKNDKRELDDPQIQPRQSESIWNIQILFEKLACLSPSLQETPLNELRI